MFLVLFFGVFWILYGPEPCLEPAQELSLPDHLCLLAVLSSLEIGAWSYPRWMVGVLLQQWQNQQSQDALMLLLRLTFTDWLVRYWELDSWELGSLAVIISAFLRVSFSFASGTRTPWSHTHYFLTVLLLVLCLLSWVRLTGLFLSNFSGS